MTTLTRASHQWATRPADERFLSLTDMRDAACRMKRLSRSSAFPSRTLEARPGVKDDGSDDMFGVVIDGLRDEPAAPTHWAFGQLCELAKAPAGYLRTLPSPMAADCINYGLKIARDVSDVGVLSRVEKEGAEQAILAAATGPNYGRIWNCDTIDALIQRFGNGRDGAFRVPGEFGKPVPITLDNTTLYASDRDMFVFLADEGHAFEVANRRNNKPGMMSRGFFVWNSEVGSASLGVATFLFDYVCSNRIVWGASQYEEIRIRHTVSGPTKFVEQVGPALEAYAKSSTAGIEATVKEAQAKRIGKDSDEVLDFLAKRFSKREAAAIVLAHESDEGRPIETVWDAVVGATAFARGKEHQDVRVGFERQAGKLLDLVG